MARREHHAPDASDADQHPRSDLTEPGSNFHSNRTWTPPREREPDLDLDLATELDMNWDLDLDKGNAEVSGKPCRHQAGRNIVDPALDALDVNGSRVFNSRLSTREC